MILSLKLIKLKIKTISCQKETKKYYLNKISKNKINKIKLIFLMYLLMNKEMKILFKINQINY